MRVETTIQIAAPISRVWEVTVDVEKWPEWSPTMQSIKRLDSGQFAAGSRARIKQPALPELTWTVTSLEKETSFTWETWLLGMRMSATHKLTAAGEGTKNELSVEVGGVTAILMWPLMRSSVRKALRQENAGLKARSESSL